MSEFSKKYSVRGIRGATTVEKDSKDLIKDATKELLIEMVKKNNVLSDDIAAVFFTRKFIKLFIEDSDLALLLWPTPFLILL